LARWADWQGHSSAPASLPIAPTFLRHQYLTFGSFQLCDKCSQRLYLAGIAGCCARLRRMARFFVNVSAGNLERHSLIPSSLQTLTANLHLLWRHTRVNVQLFHCARRHAAGANRTREISAPERSHGRSRPLAVLPARRPSSAEADILVVMIDASLRLFLA